MHIFLYFLSLLYFCISGNFAKAEIEPENTLDLEGILMCDRNSIDLEILKTGNEYLKLRIRIMERQINKQNELLIGIMNKFDTFQQSLQNMQDIILDQNKDHFTELTDFIHKENQRKQFQQQIPPVDGKWEMLSDIKQVLEKHEDLLENISEKQNKTENLLAEANWKQRTQILTDVSKKLTDLEKINKKLTDIESTTTTKTELISFQRSMASYFNKNENAKICLRAEDQKLVCTTQTYPTSCADFDATYCANNKCRIYNHHYAPKPFLVACDDQTEGGGWTVIQRRINGSVDFYRGWSEYKDGFGDIEGEFFIGLDKLHALTTTLKPVELLIQLKDFNDTMKYAKYDALVVGNETEKYILSKVGSYSGNAGDSFSYHQGFKFTTKDQDNDIDPSTNCAQDKTGAWWYEKCMWSNLNGKYYENGILPPGKRGICWNDFHGYLYTMKFVQMLIRPKKL